MKKKWILGLAPVVLAGLYLTSQVTIEGESKARLVPKPTSAESPVVSIATGKTNEYTKATIEAIRTAGGLDELVKKGSTVYIKPNDVGPSPSGAGRITDYRVIQAVAWECKRLGAKRVIVGETPVDCSWDEGFSIAGYDRIEGVELYNPNVPKEDCYYLMPERSLVGQPFFIPKAYIDADVVIDVPVMKTHFTAGVTLGLKNLGIGVPPLDIYKKGGNKAKLHDYGIMKTIPDINSIRKPDFVVIDGMVGGEGQGPTNPDPVQSGLVIASREVIAADTVGTLVMGFDPYEITHLVYAAGASQLGTMDISKIKVVGKSIAQVQQAFWPPQDSGYPYKRSTVMREATSPMTVDGSLTEWNMAFANPINQTKQFSEGWKSTKDLSATTTVMHDWNNIYVAFDVTDDALVSQKDYRDVKKPSGDGVELALSFGMPFETNMNAARHEAKVGKDYVLLAGLNEGTGVVYDKISDKVIEGSEVVFQKTATGYTAEMKLPVKSLGTELKLRDEAWIDFGVADVDVAGKAAETRAVWNAMVFGLYDDPTYAGRIIVDADKHPWAE